MGSGECLAARILLAVSPNASDVVGIPTDAIGFGTTASTEYAMLDAMLNSMSPVFPLDFGNEGVSNDLDPMSGGHSLISPNWPNTFDMGVTPPGGMSGMGDTVSGRGSIQGQGQAQGQGQGQRQGQGQFNDQWLWSGATENSTNNTNTLGQTVQAPQAQQQSLSLQPAPPAVKVEEAPMAATTEQSASGFKAGQRAKTGAEVYHSVTKPL